jgi:methyltransferase (TIGR00027 family)
MALFRALESVRPAGERLFADRFATAFLSARLRRVVAVSRIAAVGDLVRRFIDRRWPGARTSGVARTRYVDDVVQAALGSGVEQVVILGAGFDARAYRISAMTRVPVFEVDQPSTSAVKRRIVEQALGSLPGHVRFVSVDFNSDSLPGTMSAAGYDRCRQTLFIWEGVTNYLTATAVDATLRWCARAAGGSVVIFTYVHRQVLEAPHLFEGTQKLFATLARSNERWTFGLDPSCVPSFVTERGLVLDEDVGAADYRVRYFGRAAARMRGYEFYRVAVAHVAGGSSDER